MLALGEKRLRTQSRRIPLEHAPNQSPPLDLRRRSKNHRTPLGLLPPSRPTPSGSIRSRIRGTRRRLRAAPQRGNPMLGPKPRHHQPPKRNLHNNKRRHRTRLRAPTQRANRMLGHLQRPRQRHHPTRRTIHRHNHRLQLRMRHQNRKRRSPMLGTRLHHRTRLNHMGTRRHPPRRIHHHRRRKTLSYLRPQKKRNRRMLGKLFPRTQSLPHPPRRRIPYHQCKRRARLRNAPRRKARMLGQKRVDIPRSRRRLPHSREKWWRLLERGVRGSTQRRRGMLGPIHLDRRRRTS